MNHRLPSRAAPGAFDSASDAWPALIYILGTGRSGSTILDVALGSHQLITSLGEVMGLPGALATNPLGADGHRLLSSPFWIPVTHYLASESRRDLRAFNGTRNPYLLRRLLPFVYRHRARRFSLINSNVFEHVVNAMGLDGAAHKPGYVVDSSKMYWRLHFLLGSPVGRDLRVILLFRHPDEVVASEMRRGKGLVRATVGWWLHNRGALRVLRQLSQSQARVLSFVRLTTDPEGVLRAVCEWLEIKFDPAMTSPRWRGHYSFSGNARVRAALSGGGIRIEVPAVAPGLNGAAKRIVRLVTASTLDRLEALDRLTWSATE